MEQFSTAEGVTAPKDGVEVENTTPVEVSAPAEESTPVEESLTAKDVTLLDDPTATEDVTSIPFNRQRANLAQPQDNPKAVSGLSATSQIGQVKIKWQPRGCRWLYNQAPNRKWSPSCNQYNQRHLCRGCTQSRCPQLLWSISLSPKQR